jgi:flavodoxin short chain
MKIAVIYWSGTGNTETKEKELEKGAKEAGAEVSVFTAHEFSADMVGNYDKLAFGCPSMGAEQLEDAEFEPMFSAVEKTLSGKEIVLFGSYGWGDGRWMRDWQERCTSAGAKLYDGEGLIINDAPDEAGKEMCLQLGRGLASS